MRMRMLKFSGEVIGFSSLAVLIEQEESKDWWPRSVTEFHDDDFSMFDTVEFWVPEALAAEKGYSEKDAHESKVRRG